MFDYSRLKGRMREMGFTQERLAGIIGVSTVTIRAKLKGGRPYFKADEMFAIAKALEIDSLDDYFFKPKLSK